MFTPKKILLGFISFILLIFLIYSSYIYQKNTNIFDIPKTQNIDSGVYFWNGNSLEEEGKEKDIKVNFLNYSDKIVSYNSQIHIENQDINLKKGNFLVNIGEINSKYEFSGEGFSIENNGPTSFYVDNSGSRTFIFSINNILEIKLREPATGKEVNTIYLYPNEYIGFSPSVNKIIKGADLLRVSQIFSLNYINESIVKDSIINQNWSSKILFGELETSEKLKSMFSYLLKSKNQNKEILEKFINNKKISINGEVFIERYFQIFLNPEKKKIYFKNIVLRELAKIISSDENSKYLIKSLGELEVLDKTSYEEIKNIVVYYLNISIELEQNLEKKLKLSKTLNTILGKDFSFEKKYTLDLEKAFTNYNFYENQNIYNDVKNFTEKYLVNIPEKEKGYFIFFLNKFIIGGFEKINYGEKINFDDLLSIINYFSKTSIDFYEAKDEKDKIKKKKVIETGIKTYNEILKKLSSRIRTNYFKEELTDKNLLIKKANIEVESSKIFILKDDIKDIFNFFEANKSILGSTSINNLTKKQFQESKQKLDSYFQALTDYDKYELNNNKTYTNLRYDDAIQNKIKLNIVDAKRYLAKFNHIDLQNAQINIKSSDYCYNPEEENDNDLDEYCFEIKNLEVGSGVKIDFLLFPSARNRIDTKIKTKNLNGEIEEKKVSYILDEFEATYENNIGGAGDKNSNPEKYDFSNFFLFTFNPPEEYRRKDIYDGNKEDENYEKPIIRVLKTSSLLGKNGTFSVTSDYLNVKYNNIIVKEKQNSLDINVKNVDLNYEIGEKSYFGILNSAYIFKTGKISSFKNPEIIITDNSRNPELYGNPIIISGIFPLKDFYKQLEQVLPNVENISTVIDNIYETTSESDVDIKYSSNLKRFFIKTNSLNIVINGDNIEKLTYNGKNLLTKADKIDNLSKYLNNLK